MNKVLLTIASLLLLLLGGLFAIPALVDWNSFRGEFEEEASRVLGREVRVGGGVKLTLLPTPFVSFEKVRISDAGRLQGEPLLRAEEFTMWLSVTPLLRGVVEAKQVEIVRPVLRLAIAEDGSGSWSDIQLRPGALPILPADVALQSVAIIGGQIIVSGPTGEEMVRLAHIDGELAADSLEGPFRFRGLASWNGERRDYRLATTRADDDGSIRVRATSRTLTTGASYTFDVKASDIAGRPRLAGDMKARLPLGGGAAVADPAVRSGDTAKAPSAAPSTAPARFVDLTARIESDVFRLALSDLALSFDSRGQAQAIAGTASALWKDGLRIAVVLSSRWLDLDAMLASPVPPAPVPAPSVATAPVVPPPVAPTVVVGELAPALLDALPEAGDVEVRLTVDQVNLGGEAVTGLELAIERSPRSSGLLQVRRLVAEIPGGGRLDLAGTLSRPRAAPGGPAPLAFSGDLDVRATSLARLAGWSTGGALVVEPRNDGAFLMRGRIDISAGGFAILDATSEIVGTTVAGALRVGRNAEGRRRIGLAVEARRLDLSGLLPGGLELSRLTRWLAGGGARPGQGPEPATYSPSDTDFEIDIRSGEVFDGARRLRNVTAKAQLNSGRLDVEMLRFDMPEGLEVELEGALADVTDKPRGQLRGVVAAGGPAAAAAMAGLLGPAVLPAETLARLPNLAPFRLAGTTRLGGRAERAFDLSVDGTAKGGRLVATVKLDGGIAAWRDAPIDAQVSLEGADARRLIGLAPAAEAESSARSTPASPDRAFLKAVGTPATGLLALAEMQTGSTRFTYDGRAAWKPGAAPEFAGGLRLATGDLVTTLGELGFARIATAPAVEAAGLVDVVAREGVVRLDPKGFKIGGRDVTGLVTVDTTKGGQPRVEAMIAVGEASVPSLVGALIGRSTSGGSPSAGDAVWSDQPFDLWLANLAPGRLELRFGTLTLAPGAEARDVTILAELAPGRVDASRIAGRAAGGQLEGRLTLETAAAAGHQLTGTLALAEASLESIAGADAARGKVTASLSLSGRGLSPRSLVSALEGRGTLDLLGGRIARFGPAGIDRVAATAMGGGTGAQSTPLQGAALQSALARELTRGDLDIAARRLTLTLADGALRLQPVSFADQQGRVTADLSLDLGALMVAAEWRVEAKGAPRADGGAAEGRRGGALPAVSLVYTGRLGTLSRVEPRLSADALERELAVRRMEQDLAELERLRREDEARQRAEQERQSALEAERAGAAAATPQILPAPPPRWPVPNVTPAGPDAARQEPQRAPVAGPVVPPAPQPAVRPVPRGPQVPTPPPAASTPTFPPPAASTTTFPPPAASTMTLPPPAASGARLPPPPRSVGTDPSVVSPPPEPAATALPSLPPVFIPARPPDPKLSPFHPQFEPARPSTSPNAPAGSQMIPARPASAPAPAVRGAGADAAQGEAAVGSATPSAARDLPPAAQGNRSLR